MKASVLLLIASIAATASAQSLGDTHGKTYAQMLAMGYDAWNRFYTGKEGESTVGMANSAGFYADALAHRNDMLMAKLRKAERTRFGRLRASLDGFKNGAIGVGTCLTGGGTMWNPISAGIQIDTETALYGVISGRGGKAPKRVVSNVTRELATLRKAVKDAKLEGNWVGVARTSLADIDRFLPAILADAKSLPRRDSDTILDFCVTVLKNMRQTGAG